MLQTIRQISILNKIFNVHGSEWPKIVIAWVLRFLYRAGFVIGWTIIVALFVSRYGISKLPYLFVLNAFFTICGSLLYSFLMTKFDRQKLMIGTIFVAGIILFISAYFFSDNEFTFFLLLLVATSFFLVHFRILLIGFVEDLFTPLESERTFPLIEASETVAGIVAGLAVMTLSNSIEVHKFVYIWIVFLFLLVPFVLFYEILSRRVAIVSGKKTQKREAGVVKKFKEQFVTLRRSSFVRGLFIIVFLQWLLFNLLEFQYTKAVYKNVSEVVLEAGSGFEHAFIHDLGALFMLFSFSALLIQFFVGSRLINYLGVVGSMLLHPIVTLFSLFPLISSFTFGTAVLAKNNFTITSIIHTNAYHSAYYGIREDLREHTRELLEGIVRPVGAIAGTAALLILQKLFFAGVLIFSVNLLMLIVTLVMFSIIYLQQDKYTKAAVYDLLNTKDKELRFNAIDILAQRGHKNGVSSLLKVLCDEKESVSVKLRVLHAFRELQAYEAIPEIADCLKNYRSSIRNAAIDTLLGFKALKKHSDQYMLVKLELVTTLKDIFHVETREGIREKIIILLSRISHVATVQFLLDIVDDSNLNLKAEAIYALGNYCDDAIVERIYPYLSSRNLKFQINAAIALSKFGKYKPQAFALIKKFLNSKNTSKLILGLYAVGELNLKGYKKTCLQCLKSRNINIKIHAALSLAKMGYHESTPVLVDLIFSSNKKVSRRVKKLLQNVDVRVYKNIDKIVKQVVDNKVKKIVDENDVDELDDVNNGSLLTLRWLYSLAEEYDEVENIDNILTI